jgi:hypothetical protein
MSSACSAVTVYVSVSKRRVSISARKSPMGGSRYHASVLRSWRSTLKDF